MAPRLSFTIGKCWQTPGGSLVFQVSVFDGKARSKGFLELTCERAEYPVLFSLTKPEPLLPAGGIANLIRKHLAAGSISAIAVGDEDTNHQFMRLTMQGKDGANDPSTLLLIVQTKPTPEISVIKGDVSLARLKPGSQFTVAKQAPREFVDIEDLPNEGLQAWLRGVFDLSNTKTDISEHDRVSPQSILPEYQREARDRITRRIKTLRKTLKQDEMKVPSAEDLQDLQTRANLLKTYLWMVKPDSFELKLDEAQTGGASITIAIDPDRSSGANLEAFFAKLRKLERAQKLGGPRIKNLKEQIAIFESQLETMRQKELPENTVQRMLISLGLERGDPGSKTKSPSNGRTNAVKIGRIFKSSAGDPILVGRNASESDVLVKAAKSQDWWLHIADGGHGSHIIVPGNKYREGLPPTLLREAGILALHFSDRSMSKEGSVYLSRRQHIKKRKGMAPGLWQIDRAETVVIRYDSEDLSAIFSREERDGIQRQHGLSSYDK